MGIIHGGALRKILRAEFDGKFTDKGIKGNKKALRENALHQGKLLSETIATIIDTWLGLSFKEVSWWGLLFLLFLSSSILVHFPVLKFENKKGHFLLRKCPNNKSIFALLYCVI